MHFRRICADYNTKTQLAMLFFLADGTCHGLLGSSLCAINAAESSVSICAVEYWRLDAAALSFHGRFCKLACLEEQASSRNCKRLRSTSACRGLFGTSVTLSYSQRRGDAYIADGGP